LLPSVAAINAAINRTGDMTMVDLKDIGLDYATTLKLWYDRFNANLQTVRTLGLTSALSASGTTTCAIAKAAFAMRNINVMHLTYTRPNNTER
jgi:cyclopropane-fatty-acyl-phospholipid synthase